MQILGLVESDGVMAWGWGGYISFLDHHSKGKVIDTGSWVFEREKVDAGMGRRAGARNLVVYQNLANFNSVETKLRTCSQRRPARRQAPCRSIDWTIHHLPSCKRQNLHHCRICRKDFTKKKKKGRRGRKGKKKGRKKVKKCD